MAKLKDRGMILKRDDSFAARLDVAKPAQASQPAEKRAPRSPAKKSAEALAPTPERAERQKNTPAKPQISAPITI